MRPSQGQCGVSVNGTMISLSADKITSHLPGFSETPKVVRSRHLMNTLMTLSILIFPCLCGDCLAEPSQQSLRAHPNTLNKFWHLWGSAHAVSPPRKPFTLYSCPFSDQRILCSPPLLVWASIRTLSTVCLKKLKNVSLSNVHSLWKQELYLNLSLSPQNYTQFPCMS